MIKLREIDTGLRHPAWNMAADYVLLKLSAEKKIPPTLRFLSFYPTSVLVGYFQSVEQEVRQEYCMEKNILINRRITGGGTVFFDPSQVGWEIIAPVSLFPGEPKFLYELFGKSVALGLKELGINAEYKPRNDIEVYGRKISGMGGTTLKGSFLFQGTLLVEDKLEEMLFALRVPIEKLKPKEIDSVRERVTCIETELKRVPEREELKNAIKNGFKKMLGIETYLDELSDFEVEEIEKEFEKFKSPEWIYRIKVPLESQGLLTGTYRSSFGTVRVNAVVNAKHKMLRQTIITGDFLLDSRRAIYDLERLLKNIHFDERKILKILSEFFDQHPELPEEEFINAFYEVFWKWRWVQEGFAPDEANHLFAVNLIPGEKFAPKHFLFPYCTKKPDCKFRYRPDCPVCGLCSVGDGYSLAKEAGLESITIVSFEDLMEKFKFFKRIGVTSYVGSCCEPFYIKHQEEFRESGLKAILIDIRNSSCYDLGKAKEAYEGRFENQTQLDLSLIKKVLDYIKIR